jgi:oligoendopeptidase F
MMSIEHVLLRSEAPEESTWNQALVFPTWADWEQEYNDLVAGLPALEAFAGHLGEGPEMLASWMETFSRFRARVWRLDYFAMFASAVDTSQAEPKGRVGQADGLFSDFQGRTAFAEPEILALGNHVLEWSKTEPRLAPYTHYFDNLLRQQSHRRSSEVEAVLGGFSEVFSGINGTYGELTDTDLKFAEAHDSQGQPHPVRQVHPPPSGIQSPDRRLRQTSWESYTDGYRSVQNTLAGIFLTVSNTFARLLVPAATILCWNPSWTPSTCRWRSSTT